MDITKEKLLDEAEARILKTFEEKAPEYLKAWTDNPEFKELLKQHVNKEILPSDTVKGEPVKFAQSAKLIRAIMRRDHETAKKIQEEELEKYGKEFGWEEKTLSTYMTETSNVQGLYLCPYEWYRDIFRLPQAYGIARRDCFVIPMTTKIMYINTISTMPSSYWIDAQVDLSYRSKTVTKPHFGQVELKPVQQVAITVWEDELLADATPPLVQLITNLMVETFSRGEDNALFNGNGGFGIAGILANAAVSTVNMNAGHINFADINADYLSEMIDAVAALQATDGAKFYFHPDIMGHIRVLKDTTGDYIWQKPSGTAPGTIWNYPYEISNVMPGNASSAVSTEFVVFGNLKKSVVFADRQRLTIKLLTEASIDGTSLAQYNLSALRFNERLDIEVILPLAISVLETAAV